MGDMIDVVVHQMTRASERALLIELRPVDPDRRLPSFEAGAHLDVQLGALVRQYSLLNPDDETHRYLICVLLEPDGRGGSAMVHHRLRVGDRLTVAAPRNTFAVADAPHHAVLIGGGIGITPLLAMAESMHRHGASFELHCYAARADALPLREYLDGRPYSERVLFHFSEDGDSLRSAAPAFLSQKRADAIAYVCGPSGFIETARRYARDGGWADAELRVERFEASAPVDLAGGDFSVVASSTGQAMPVEAGETIAEVLERNGYEVFLSCEQGICGSCITRVLSGVPDHRDEVQSPAEHAANTQINICCSRALTPVLELEI